MHGVALINGVSENHLGGRHVGQPDGSLFVGAGLFQKDGKACATSFNRTACANIFLARS